MTDQERFIEDARSLLKPSRVFLGHVPNWFRLAVLRLLRRQYHYRGYTRGEVAVCELQMLFPGVSDWLDHWGAAKSHDAQQMFVSEPYGITAETLQSVELLAEKLDCRCYVSANSWWFPTRTIRIAFLEKVPEKLARPCDRPMEQADG